MSNKDYLLDLQRNEAEIIRYIEELRKKHSEELKPYYEMLYKIRENKPPEPFFIPLFDVPFETNIKFQVPQTQPTITVEDIKKKVEKLMVLTCRMNPKPNDINDRIDEVHEGLREILNLINGTYNDK